jgi:UDPglucose 6-dehydrogenase
MNEISQLAHAIGADVESVRIGIGKDQRIGPSFLKAGVGYGGSCFPKDVQALVHQMKSIGIDPLLLSGIEAVNVRQKQFYARRILDAIKGTPNPVVAVWGLAFKSDTDDMREAPSLEIIEALTEAGATIKTFDPQAMENARRILGDAPAVTFCHSVADATKGADAVAVVTEWNEFITQDWHKIAKLMRGKHIFDGRNCLASKRVSDAGLFYHAVGRPELAPGQGRPGAMGMVNAG